MEIRFKSGQKNTLNDLINSTLEEIKIVGQSSDDDDVIIENWNFINYKRLPNETYGKSVHLKGISFTNCTFKDVNFVGGVPITNCKFKNCVFENCILTDLIKDTKFKECRFIFCIIGGEFLRTKMKKTCTFEKVLGWDFCSNDIKLELLRYFYPIESKIYDDYIIGKPYLVDKKSFDDFFQNYLESFETCIIDGKEYYKDIVSYIDFNINNFKPKIRIVGKFAPLITDCIPYEKYNEKTKENTAI